MSDPRRPTVAVLIPALDEERTLPGVLAALPRDAVDRVVVVDNGSRDGTERVARSLGAEVVGEPRRGYGGACLAGIAHLSAAPPEILVILDADHSDDPRLLPRLVDPVAAGDAEMVIGSRVLGGIAPGAMTPPQRFGNWLATKAISARTGEVFSDLGPFRAVRFARLLGLGMEDRTWGWNVEMHLKASRAGWRILEVPAPYRRRPAGRSKISGTALGVARAGARILWALARYG